MKNNEQKTVLIIDDESVIRYSVSGFLEDLGFKTIMAEGGKAGVEIFTKEKIDLVMVDIRMPEMDGIEVLKVISEMNADVPLIVVSGTGDINDAVNALRHGAWDYLMKPVDDMAILEHSVQNNLDKAGMKKEIIEYQKYLEKMVEERTSELQTKTNKLEEEIRLRQKTEEKLKEYLKEKELLIQEIHHRVKNNLAIIVSLLNLQSFVLSDDQAKNVLLDCENRIRAMALVHESLFKRDNLQFVDLKDYAKKLVKGILTSFCNEEQKIKVTYDIDTINMDLNRLISLGLIINEIVCNSTKHAFDQVKDPLIQISLKRKDKNILEMIVSDNGVGLKQEESIGSNTIGLKIIDTLIDQINGTMSRKSGNGTQYIIRMPLA